LPVCFAFSEQIACEAAKANCLLNQNYEKNSIVPSDLPRFISYAFFVLLKRWWHSGKRNESFICQIHRWF
jgi:hypothetical protein